MLEEKVEMRTRELHIKTEEALAATAAAEIARIQAEQANQAKSVFISTLSHEIRTPLYAVLLVARGFHTSVTGMESLEALHCCWMTESLTLNNTRCWKLFDNLEKACLRSSQTC